jgi:hypothetical protein
MSRRGLTPKKTGIFDALDPRMAGCEKNSRVIFRKDGTGTSLVMARRLLYWHFKTMTAPCISKASIILLKH